MARVNLIRVRGLKEHGSADAIAGCKPARIQPLKEFELLTSLGLKPESKGTH